MEDFIMGKMLPSLLCVMSLFLTVIMGVFIYHLFTCGLICK
jgi:hypothetical protein